ncbi:MAG: hypothetical protein KU37_09305 [Sulfuricurvum sp. PC08-66]|nr:MAG: hypothetical protein KU37_09305 [Sulfuricurvum sp. PC08-66]
MKGIIDKLDLSGYVREFEHFLARPKPLFLEGDQQLHGTMIRLMESIDFTPPKAVVPLDDAIARLKKQGVLTLSVLFEWVKILRYVRYLSRQKFPQKVLDWLDEIKIDPFFESIEGFFLDDGSVNVAMDERLGEVTRFLERAKIDIAQQMSKLLHTEKLQPYLVDKQVHLQQEHETLLLKAGFNHVLKGSIVARSQGGFFYVVPQSIETLRAQKEHFVQEREALLYEWAKTFSAGMQKWVKFLEFLNRRFDQIDHYQARIFFAKAKGYSFLGATKTPTLRLVNFAHPALAHPKPITIDASANIIMITGVNAGGKTMLLKAILAATWLAKYLLPMRIDAHASSIPHFKHLHAIIDDPQNVGNDISTFAGRMVEFSTILQSRDAIIGVDEIELGTDSDEAASLFKVMLEALVEKGAKIIVTTHHKRLAALMANRDDVTLMAALYDEANRLPTYEFLQGSIGKSYAFETAQRYGIPSNLVTLAKAQYGQDQEKLSELIERSSELERGLRQKHKELDEKNAQMSRLLNTIEEERHALHQEVQGAKVTLSRAYVDAIDEAKSAAKAIQREEIHRGMNKAHAKLPKAPPPPVKKVEPIKVGDRVKYLTNYGTVLALESKEAFVAFESGMRMRAPLVELSLAAQQKSKPPKTTLQKPTVSRAALKLDLHGLRSDEALEKLDQFISDALLQGWDEVLVYHGIGTGKLAHAVNGFLRSHPSVKGFTDAPPAMGGYGAKIVTL